MELKQKDNQSEQNTSSGHGSIFIAKHQERRFSITITLKYFLILFSIHCLYHPWPYYLYQPLSVWRLLLVLGYHYRAIFHGPVSHFKRSLSLSEHKLPTRHPHCCHALLPCEIPANSTEESYRHIQLTDQQTDVVKNIIISWNKTQN